MLYAEISSALISSLSRTISSGDRPAISYNFQKVYEEQKQELYFFIFEEKDTINLIYFKCPASKIQVFVTIFSNIKI